MEEIPTSAFDAEALAEIDGPPIVIGCDDQVVIEVRRLCGSVCSRKSA